MSTNTPNTPVMDEVRFVLARLDKSLAKWRERFAANPAEALEWSNDTFKEAAEWQVFQQVMAWADEGCPTDVLIDRATKMALRCAEFPTFSTSQPANLIHVLQGAAWVRAKELLEGVQS